MNLTIPSYHLIGRDFIIKRSFYRINQVSLSLMWVMIIIHGNEKKKEHSSLP